MRTPSVFRGCQSTEIASVWCTATTDLKRVWSAALTLPYTQRNLQLDATGHLACMRVSVESMEHTTNRRLSIFRCMVRCSQSLSNWSRGSPRSVYPRADRHGFCNKGLPIYTAEHMHGNMLNGISSHDVCHEAPAWTAGPPCSAERLRLLPRP